MRRINLDKKDEKIAEPANISKLRYSLLISSSFTGGVINRTVLIHNIKSARYHDVNSR